MKSKVFHLCCICISAVLLLVGVSHAKERESKWSIGFGLIASEIESDLVLWSFQQGSDLHHQDRDVGGKFYLGYKHNDYASASFALNYFGKLTVTGGAGGLMYEEGVVWQYDQDGTEFEAELYNVCLGGTLALPLKKITNKQYIKHITPFATLGLHYWDLDKSLTSGSVTFYESQSPTRNPVNPISYNFSDDSGMNWFFESGIFAKINDTFSLIIAYEWYGIDNNMVRFTDAVYLNLVYRF